MEYNFASYCSRSVLLLLVMISFGQLCSIKKLPFRPLIITLGVLGNVLLFSLSLYSVVFVCLHVRSISSVLNAFAAFPILFFIAIIITIMELTIKQKLRERLLRAISNPYSIIAFILLSFLVYASFQSKYWQDIRSIYTWFAHIPVIGTYILAHLIGPLSFIKKIFTVSPVQFYSYLKDFHLLIIANSHMVIVIIDILLNLALAILIYKTQDYSGRDEYSQSGKLLFINTKHLYRRLTRRESGEWKAPMNFLLKVLIVNAIAGFVSLFCSNELLKRSLLELKSIWTALFVFYTVFISGFLLYYFVKLRNS